MKPTISPAVLVFALLVVACFGDEPSEAERHYSKGVELRHRPEEAIREYDKAIELDPGLVYAYVDRAVAYTEVGKYHQAIADLNVAIQLSPEFAKAYLSRGRAYAELGDTEQAIADLERALSLYPAQSSRAAEIRQMLADLKGR